MSRVIDEFNYNIHCVYCEVVTEHNVQKIEEEDNGKYIGYYAKCDVCGNITSISEDVIDNILD